jgi:hypothetical protein
MVMEATDIRALSREARHERRAQVIRLRQAGLTCDAVAGQTGLSRTGGRSQALARCAQRPPGGRWTTAQCAAGGLRRLITDKTPDQLKMPYARWTPAAVAPLI